MGGPRLYKDLAGLWPLLSPVEDYVEEGALLRAAFREKLGPGRHSLLDLGIGGGHHHSHLGDDFDATGVDLSADMLANSRRLNPNVEHHVGDMRAVRLGRQFDAVLIHDAISYMLCEDDLRAAFRTAAVHLRSNGVLIVVPDWFREDFRDRSVSHDTHRRNGSELTHIEYLHDPDPADTTVETVMFLLFRKRGKPLEIVQDCHTTGLFPRATWIRLMQDAGFETETQPFVEGNFGQQHTLLIGVRRGK